jgi:hypothetical protein
MIDKIFSRAIGAEFLEELFISESFTNNLRFYWNGKRDTAIYQPIQPRWISHSDAVDMMAQRATPCSKGRGPTFFNVWVEMPLPIRKRVAVSPIFASCVSRL